MSEVSAEALREGADRVAEILREAGFQAYFAGGCVRDQLLGTPPKDYDIATDATPEQVAATFRRTVLVGAAFGVVKVLLGRREYEVATFRTEGEYTDGRRPDEVAYATDPEEDVRRRDFTVNALLMDPREDRIVDFVGGQADLQAEVIRAVGDPFERFAEDRLRMLRAVRFAARLGFAIEPATQAAIEREAEHLRAVSVERIKAEIEGILKSARPGLGARLLAETGLLAPALPYVTDAAALEARWSRLPAATEGLDVEDRVIVGWALTFDGVEGRAAEKAMRGLTFSKAQLRGAQALLSARAVLESMADEASADVVRLFAGGDAARNAAYQRALLGDGAMVEATRRVQEDLRARPLPVRPLLGGADLQAMGVKPGRHFKDLLAAVDDAVLERRVVTKADAEELVRARLG